MSSLLAPCSPSAHAGSVRFHIEGGARSMRAVKDAQHRLGLFPSLRRGGAYFISEPAPLEFVEDDVLDMTARNG